MGLNSQEEARFDELIKLAEEEISELKIASSKLEDLLESYKTRSVELPENSFEYDRVLREICKYPKSNRIESILRDVVSLLYKFQNPKLRT